MIFKVPPNPYHPMPLVLRHMQTDRSLNWKCVDAGSKSQQLMHPPHNLKEAAFLEDLKS